MKKLSAIASVVFLFLSLTTACGRKGPDAPPDKTPPEIVATNPVLGSVDVPSNTAISVTFSELVDAETISFLLMSAWTGTVPCTMSYSDKTATFTPSNTLAYNTQYFATISAGVMDVAGNVMPGKYPWSFTTGTAQDTTPPAVLPDSLGPADGATNIVIFPPISVTFNEPVNPSTVNSGTVKVSGNASDVPGAVTLDNTGTKVIFMLLGPLAYDTTYTVTIVGGTSGVKDMAGNALVADYLWSFKTEPAPPNPTYALTVTKTGTGAGSVLPNTGSISWNGNTGVGTYASGTLVSLTATANAGSTFSNWSSCDSVVGTTCVLNMTSDKNVTATFAINTYTITATAGTGGSISPSGSVSVSYGASQSFTITPAANYHVADVLVDGGSVGAVTSYAFTNVTSNHTISASFTLNPTITASAGANGSITPSGPVSVSYGASQSFTITPAANYHVASVLVDGGSVGAMTSYTFTNVTTNHTISASFAIDNRTITATAGTGGSISPSGSVSVNYDANQTFTITPNANYHIADVLVDGASVGAVTTYTFTNVTTNHTISASFATNTLTIASSASTGGSISPSGSVSVNYGSDQTFTITPAANYHVADVLVDGGSVGAVTSYTFTNVTTNHTISASFVLNPTITASAGPKGSISPSGSVSVNYGADQTFTITPANNYHVADVLVDEASVGAMTSYTFTNVTTNHTISASFAIDTRTITATAGTGGSISPSGSVSVNYDANQTFTITPNANYHIADVLVDGASVGAVTTYTFTHVKNNHTIAASFAIDTRTITATAGTGGSISPSGSVSVNYDASQTFVITPDLDYSIADVLVDNVSQGAIPSFTFLSVTVNHTIDATFKQP